MKVEIDTANKTIKALEDINAYEFYKGIKELVGATAYKEYTLLYNDCEEKDNNSCGDGLE